MLIDGFISVSKVFYFTRGLIVNPSQCNLLLVNLLIEDIDDFLIKILVETELATISNVLNNIIFHSLISGLKA